MSAKKMRLMSPANSQSFVIGKNTKKESLDLQIAKISGESASTVEKKI